MNNERIFRPLGMLFVVMAVFVATVATAGSPYSFQMQLTVDGRVVSTPSAVVAVGAQGEIEVAAKSGNAWRVQIHPKHAVTKAGITTVMVQLRLLKRESPEGAWTLMASPEMMGSPTPDEPMTLHWSHMTTDGAQLELDVRVAPGHELPPSDAKPGLSLFPDAHANLIKTCKECVNGDTVC